MENIYKYRKYYDTLISELTGCDSVFEINLFVDNLPSFNITSSATNINQGGNSTISLTGGIDYEWDFDPTLSCLDWSENIVSPNETTTYYINCYSSVCSVRDEITITVNEGVFVPEGFSPNNDGIGDTWNITGTNNYSQISIIVFNRFGNKVYETKIIKYLGMELIKKAKI